MASLWWLRPDIERAADGAPLIDIARLRLQSPVPQPGRIVAVRGNYGHTHGPEGAAPELFLKAGSSVRGPGEGVALRFPERRVDHEVELAAIIGATIDRVSVDRALDAVAGYCVGIDVTLRGPEDRGLRKSLDGHTVLGPWLVTPDELGLPDDLEIELTVGRDRRQWGRTSGMVHDVASLVAAASSWFTLEPGDVIMTGTPPGVGPLERGDTVRCAIERIGAMTVEVN